MEKIYGWKEVTKEALPTFENINDADEKWLWGMLRENLDETEIEYTDIENKIKQLYGSQLTKKYPNQGTEFIKYDQKSNKYVISQTTLDAIKDAYLLDKIEKNKSGYTVQIVEYLVDYTDSENDKVLIKNLNEEIIYELTEEEATDGNVTKIVKENIDKFTKKKVTLQKENENIIIKKVEKEK